MVCEIIFRAEIMTFILGVALSRNSTKASNYKSLRSLLDSKSFELVDVGAAHTYQDSGVRSSYGQSYSKAVV